MFRKIESTVLPGNMSPPNNRMSGGLFTLFPGRCFWLNSKWNCRQSECTHSGKCTICRVRCASGFVVLCSDVVMLSTLNDEWHLFSFVFKCFFTDTGPIVPINCSSGNKVTPTDLGKGITWIMRNANNQPLSLQWRHNKRDCVSNHQTAAEVPVKFPSDRTILNTNLAASRLYEILRKNVFSDIETGPCVLSVYPTVCSGANQRKHQSFASLAFVRIIHRWPVNFPHKGPVTRKCFHLVTSSCCA